jgi:hypothetical protein
MTRRIIPVNYEPRFERFEAQGPDGRNLSVEFRKAGFLTLGDKPELYFFAVAGEETVVGISGSALKRLEEKRRLSREEKIDLAGSWLKRQIEAGVGLHSQHLFLRDEELAAMVGELSIQV